MISPTHTLQEVLTYNPELEHVLARYELEGVHLHTPLKRISLKQCPDPEMLVEVLRAFDCPDRFCPTRFLRFPISSVLDYLYRTHRYYTQKRLLEIEQSVSQLAVNFGHDHPLLLLLHSFFPTYRRKLEAHIQLEEDTLFPYVLHLQEWKEEQNPDAADSIFASYSLDEFLHSHEEDELDGQLHRLQGMIQYRYPELANDFMFQVLSTQLDAFERDLLIHERIEEDVLVPKARRLEAM
jgi:regulator of cell morphogenesis and NO signaling